MFRNPFRDFMRLRYNINVGMKGSLAEGEEASVQAGMRTLMTSYRIFDAGINDFSGARQASNDNDSQRDW
jgi:hypothetical protein